MSETLPLHAAIESILENASLTADLDDEAADALIEWGISCVRKVYLDAAGREDTEDFVYQQMRAIRKMMRAINKWAARRGESDLEQEAAAFEKLLERISKACGCLLPPMTGEQKRAFIEQHHAASPRQTIVDLRNLCQK